MPTAPRRTSMPSAKPAVLDPTYLKSTQQFREHEAFLVREVHHRLLPDSEADRVSQVGSDWSVPEGYSQAFGEF